GAYDYDAVVSVQWPFGYGLSYTTFKYDNLRCSHSEFGVNDNLIFTIDVTNTGNCTGKEVVMLFSRDMVASLTPDNRRLRAFEKVELKPGETKTVTLPIKASDLAFVDYDGKWVLEKGKFRMQAGTSVMDITCNHTYKWTTPNK
ncbi:fibronectin type III-like domain-contianing protein, partial [Duncaniella muris]|uniref:fibronectin type III-like domain-contianing protein n=5 Tax=Duncaniella muris TaxID=2094150 RepID=UPI0027310C08